jgi:hypothetical protein
MTSVADFLNSSGGGKSLKFPEVGTEYKDMTIISSDVAQARDLEGQPKVWDDGSPVMQLRIKVQTDLAENGDDDGVRTWYLSGGKGEATTGTGLSAELALKEAVKKSGVSASLPPGTKISVLHSGVKAADKRGHNPAKRFKVRLEAGPVINMDDEGY